MTPDENEDFEKERVITAPSTKVGPSFPNEWRDRCDRRWIYVTADAAAQAVLDPLYPICQKRYSMSIGSYVAFQDALGGVVGRLGGQAKEQTGLLFHMELCCI